MIIVDDRLSLEVLAGRRTFSASGPVATTWSFHYRLLRALAQEARLRALTTADAKALRRLAADPPADRLTVLDPRQVTDRAAELARRHRLNLLAAELMASARIHRATVVLSTGNVGRAWPAAFEVERLELRVEGAGAE